MDTRPFEQSALLSIAYYKGRKALNPKAKWGDQAICAWPRSRGDFSHAEMVFGYRASAGGAGLCASASLRDHGVRFKSIDLSSGRWELRHIEGATELDYERCIRWFGMHLCAPYDLLGIAGFVLPGALQLKRAFYCSEACALAWGAPAQQISPSRLFELQDAVFAPHVASTAA